MSKEAEIIKLLHQLGNRGSVLAPATVTAVDENACTCTVKIGSFELFKVRLNAAENGQKGFLLVPAVGSSVLVSNIGSSEVQFAVVSFTQVDKIIMNGGELGGLIKISELESKLNDLVSKFNNHVHSGVVVNVTGGSGTPAVGVPGNSDKPTTTASQFKKADFENEKITHG